jgi:hypothetical protein
MLYAEYGLDEEPRVLKIVTMIATDITAVSKPE